MKKILICLIAILAVSCENYTTKYFGGTMTIDVKPGYKVTSATFKEGNLWYFVEPMDSTYVPKQKNLSRSLCTELLRALSFLMKHDETIHNTRADRQAD